MKQRALVVGLASVAVALALGVTAWLTVGREEATAAVDTTAADTTAADTTAAGSAAAGPDSALAAGGDSAAARLPHPPAMIGTWVHGDGRSRYGDSLVLRLHENGTARLHERRWALDRTGWHSSQVERDGAWSMRYRGGDRTELCAEWARPEKVSSCDRIFTGADSTSDSTRTVRTLEYAGRHWRRVPDAVASDSAPRRRRR